MRWSSFTPVLVALALAAFALLSGCGGDDDLASTDPANTTAATNAEKEARKEVNRRIREESKRRRRLKRPNAGKQTPAQRAATARRATQRAAVRRRRERESETRADREFDKDFRASPFERLIARLPVRRPPLYVEQYISSSGSHRVYTAVNRRRFLCEMSPAQRRRAVERFFRAADRVMRAGGIDDFVQIVTLTSETAQELPALANARRGSVSLSERGRERNPC